MNEEQKVKEKAKAMLDYFQTVSYTHLTLPTTD